MLQSARLVAAKDLEMRQMKYERDLLAHQLHASAAEKATLRLQLRDLQKQMQVCGLPNPDTFS